MTEHLYQDPYDPQLIAEQDKAIEQFMTDIERRPVLTEDPFVLEEYLWNLGSIAQRAAEGFARQKPGLCRYSTRASYLGDFMAEDQEGELAYETWMRDQSSELPESGTLSRNFILDTVQESTTQTYLYVSSYFNAGTDENRQEITFRQDHIDSDDSEQSNILVFLNALKLPQNAANDRRNQESGQHRVFRYSQDQCEYNYQYQVLDGQASDEAAHIAESMGTEAVDIHERYGKVGLYRNTLWQQMYIVGSLATAAER